MKTTIGALFYGDYPELAERCLTSFWPLVAQGKVKLRVGLNAVGQRTRAFLLNLVDELPEECRKNVWIEDSLENIHKYPMLRRLIDKTDTENFCWFDDDSYLSTTPQKWLEYVQERIEYADMLGAIYTIGAQGGQIEWIKHQPWYRGEAVRTPFSFITGGWWMIRKSVLEATGWPWPTLDHRGGDVMLGVALAQFKFTKSNCTFGVKINADTEGNNGKSPRRGFDSKPVGFDFKV